MKITELAISPLPTAQRLSFQWIFSLWINNSRRIILTNPLGLSLISWMVSAPKLNITAKSSRTLTNGCCWSFKGQSVILRIFRSWKTFQRTESFWHCPTALQQALTYSPIFLMTPPVWRWRSRVPQNLCLKSHKFSYFSGELVNVDAAAALLSFPTAYLHWWRNWRQRVFWHSLFTRLLQHDHDVRRKYHSAVTTNFWPPWATSIGFTVSRFKRPQQMLQSKLRHMCSHNIFALEWLTIDSWLKTVWGL